MSQAATAENYFITDLTEQDVDLTELAQEKMAELFTDADDDIEAIRIYVSGGGCGGMSAVPSSENVTSLRMCLP